MITNWEEYDPLTNTLKATKEELELSRAIEKRWFCDDNRSLAIAVNLLRDNQVIAIPTDTIYGFAALAQNNDAINSLYEIKKRNESKPLAICVSNVSDVKKWGVVDDLPGDLLNDLFPGPVTIILKRTPNLNSSLNPGTTNVGIRVPNSKFTRQIVDLIGEPLALTSANESNKPSSLKPEEFSDLWSYLGGIFITHQNSINLMRREQVRLLLICRKLGNIRYFVMVLH